MKPFEDQAHKTRRAKMEAMTGSPKNFESCSDKAHRFACGGYADGGEVEDQPSTPIPPSPFEEIKPMRIKKAPKGATVPPKNML